MFIYSYIYVCIYIYHFSPAFEDLPRELLSELLARDKLNIDELDLFRAVMEKMRGTKQQSAFLMSMKTTEFAPQELLMKYMYICVPKVRR